MIKILVEGPDGHGKTRLIEDLCGLYSVLPIKYLSRPLTRSDAENRIRHLIFSTIRCNKFDLLVWDRHVIVSEQVYGPILRNGPLISTDLLKAAVNAFVLSPKNLLIFCMTTADPEFDIEFKDRKTEIYPALIANYHHIVGRYYQLYKETPLVHHYDWRDENSLPILQNRISKIMKGEYYECE
jgi:hypothetical protein